MEWGQRQVKRFDEWFNSSDATSCDILSDLQSCEDYILHCTSIFAHNGEVDETPKTICRIQWRRHITAWDGAVTESVLSLSNPWRDEMAVILLILGLSLGLKGKIFDRDLECQPYDLSSAAILWQVLAVALKDGTISMMSDQTGLDDGVLRF